MSKRGLRRKEPAGGQSDIEAARVQARASTRQTIVTGIVALLAAGVATFGTLYATQATLEREDDREDRRLDIQATGAARILSGEFMTAANQLLVIEHDRLYRPLEPSFRVEMPDEDKRLVFSRLSPNEWAP